MDGRQQRSMKSKLIKKDEEVIFSSFFVDLNNKKFIITKW